MKRKYDCPKVKIGDWVYFYYNGHESKYSYKVVKTGASGYRENIITVEINKKDDFIEGWKSKEIGSGRYWNINMWKKKYSPIIEIE